MKTQWSGLWQGLLPQTLAGLCCALGTMNSFATTSLLTQPVDLAPWQITHRDFHSQVWESSNSIVDPISGRTRAQISRFVELGSGINFIGQNGFEPTREKLAISPDGNFAVAQFGPHQLIVEMNNLNSATALDFLSTIDGVRLKMGPVAVAWFDPLAGAAGTNIVLAVIQDSAGELTAPNVVTFRNCFQGGGLRASIRVTYRKAGIS